MRIAVIHGDYLNTTPPRGYGGITRLAWAAAQEFAALGARVRLFAPRLVEDTAVYAALDGAYQGAPERGQLDDSDAVYMADPGALRGSLANVADYVDGPLIIEENAASLFPTTHPHSYHLIYRADRLDAFPVGRAWLCDQILDRAEIGPPQTPAGYVAWMGRIHPEKGIESLLTFAAALPSVLIRVAGCLQERRFDWPKNIHFVGQVDGAAKREFLTGANALLYTVNALWTGAGEVVLTEAVACGIPVLAQSFTRGTPATRLIVDGWNGFVHHDVGVLARLYPLTQGMNRDALFAAANARLAPAVVARDRLERILGAVRARRESNP